MDDYLFYESRPMPMAVPVPVPVRVPPQSPFSMLMSMMMPPRPRPRPIIVTRPYASYGANLDPYPRTYTSYEPSIYESSCAPEPVTQIKTNNNNTKKKPIPLKYLLLGAGVMAGILIFLGVYLSRHRTTHYAPSRGW